jgi:hypothetical protein
MNKKRIMTFVLIGALIVAYLSYYFYGKKLMKKNGVYTIAKVISWKSAEQGSDLYFEIYYNGKVYKSKDGGGYPYTIGKFYYIKVLSDNPSQFEDLYGEVPKCILKRPLPKKGWKEIPKCN